MDLVAEELRESLFKDREDDLIRLSRPGDVTCFRTSIWDETLYRYIMLAAQMRDYFKIFFLLLEPGRALLPC